jgi:hypothetical protein
MIISGSQDVCGTGARRISLPGLILLLHAGSVAATAGSLTFAGVSFSPGSTIKAIVPLSAQEKSLAVQGGNAVPPNAVAVLATPSNFDPLKTMAGIGRVLHQRFQTAKFAMTLLISMAESDLRKVGWCLRVMVRSLHAATLLRGVGL